MAMRLSDHKSAFVNAPDAVRRYNRVGSLFHVTVSFTPTRLKAVVKEQRGLRRTSLVRLQHYSQFAVHFDQADLSTLDIAMNLSIPCGGWCPSGPRAEGGRIPEKYPLKETTSADDRQRTEWNVSDSDGTLVLTWGQPTGGTALTIRLARRRGKPFSLVDLAAGSDVEGVLAWIGENGIAALNVARPRGSKGSEVYGKAGEFPAAVLRGLV